MGDSDLIYYFNNIGVTIKMYKAANFNIHDFVWVNFRIGSFEKYKVVVVPKRLKFLKKLVFILCYLYFFFFNILF